MAGSNVWFEIEYKDTIGYVHISYTDLGETEYIAQHPLGEYLTPDANNLNTTLLNNARLWRFSKIYYRVPYEQSALLLIETGSKALNYKLNITMDGIDYKGNYFEHGLVDFEDYSDWDLMNVYNKAFPINITPNFEAFSSVLVERGETLDLDYTVESTGFFGQYKSEDVQMLLPNTKYIIEVQNASHFTSDISISVTGYETNVSGTISYLLELSEPQ